MSNLMELLGTLEGREERRKQRYERRAQISTLISVVRETFENIEQRMSGIDGDDQLIVNQATNLNQSVDRLQLELEEDIQDLLDELQPLYEIICPVGKLIERYQGRLKQLQSHFTRSTP